MKPSPSKSRRASAPDEADPALLRRAVKDLAPPASFFSGLTLGRAAAPDNIICFKRTDITAFKPEGVSDNYHHRFELVVVLEKAGPVRIGERSYLLAPGEAALIFPNQFHHYMDVETGPLEWLFITFELGTQEPLKALRNAPRVLGPTELHSLAKVVREYVGPCGGEPDTVEISYRLSRFLRGMTVAAPLSNLEIPSADKARDALLEKINLYVRSHLSQAPTIGALAEALGYSASHLRSVFRTQLGVSLGRYLRESRLSRAAQLLQSSELNISGVAERAGFESLFAFSRSFKKAYGMLPKTYSKLLREPKL